MNECVMPELKFPLFKKRQDEPWQEEVARQLNEIVARAEFVAGDPQPVDCDVDFVVAAHAIVLRVAEFEKIEARRT